MAMKPMNETTYGQMYSFTAPSSYSVTNRVIAVRSIGSITTKSGDYIHPTTHAYTSMRSRGYIGSIQSYNGFVGLQSGTYGASQYPYNWNIFGTEFDAHAYNAALSNAYEKLRGNVDLSVDLVQWRQTLQMISLYRRFVSGIAKTAIRLMPWVDRVETLKRDIVSLERLDKRRKRLQRELNSSLNFLARARLEAMYGWSPTMRTLHDLCMQTITPKEPGLLRCEGKGKVILKREIQSFAISSVIPIRHIALISDRAKVVMYYNPVQSVLNDLGKISSLNPVSVLYEATPFSFVLDWAHDVGGWIRTLETAFLHRNDFAGGYQTRTKRVIVSSVCSGIHRTSSTSFLAYDLKGDGVLTRFSRTALSSAPFPTKPVKQFTFGVSRQLNAIALAKVTLLRADNHVAYHRR